MDSLVHGDAGGEGNALLNSLPLEDLCNSPEREAHIPVNLSAGVLACSSTACSEGPHSSMNSSPFVHRSVIFAPGFASLMMTARASAGGPQDTVSTQPPEMNMQAKKARQEAYYL